MRRFFFSLLLIAGVTANAAAPVASITGPTTATVGQPVMLDLAGSATDADYPLQVEVAGDSEFKPTLRVWYDNVGKPGLAVLTAPRAGSYTVVVVAIGKPDGSQTNVMKIAAWPVAVDPIAPAPKPPTPPDPDPQPPTPAPVTGNLWGVLVVPDLPTPAQAALRTSPAIRAAFTTSNANFRSYLASESEVQGAGWKAGLASAGGAPAVLWLTDGGKLAKVTPAATEAAILADLKALRGGK